MKAETEFEPGTVSGKVYAYSYSDPLFESVPDRASWGRPIDRFYQDLGERQQLSQLLQDCRTEPIAYLLVRRLEELGDSVVCRQRSSGRAGIVGDQPDCD